MTGEFPLDWAILAVSLFNSILLVWLGLSVLLNAERRRWGVWLVGCGLLTGGAFFLSHTAILGLGLEFFGKGLILWWQMGWIPVVALPFAWYVVMLWYAGFWDDRQTPLYRRHRAWFRFASLLTLVTLVLFLFANPLPIFTENIQLDYTAIPSVGEIPLLVISYPVNLIFCLILSLDVLRSPGPSGRVMGELARRRARPWLVAASVVQLVVNLLVAWVMIYLLSQAREGSLQLEMTTTLAWFDLSIASLIGVAAVLTGQAVVSYEVFTGKTLPRRGLQRYWHRAVVLAGGYSALLGWSLALQLHPLFSLLMATIMMTVFYALLGWRSYVERERFMQLLRPFVTSQRLYDQLIKPTTSIPMEVDVMMPFEGLCEDVLETGVAYMAALGPLAPFVGPPLVYPRGSSSPLPPLAEITKQFKSPAMMWLPIRPTQYGGASWAVPLWSERGLVGVLLLGMKRGGGLYTQEEIEIARTIGERLIDVWASAEMARRLMTLQRQRLAESQVLDQRARRVLHDEMLPRLHTAMLALRSEQLDNAEEKSQAIELLGEVHRQVADLLRDLPTATAPEVVNMGLIGALRQLVDEELPDAFNDVTWQIAADAERGTKTIPSLTAEVLYFAAREAIRNAARHGRGTDSTRPLNLKVGLMWEDGLEIHIEDDGKGIMATGEMERLDGQGLAFHGTMMAVVGGSLSVESVPGDFTRVLLTLPREAW
ncbi:MAG: hypothetical protein GTO14_25190 [Anaerolineales bacterium]|nr:hypothetical protein [Anaerolineales bacterium]